MVLVPPDGLNASSLIAAKGAELKFWIIKTNESAEKKLLNVRAYELSNVSGTVETLRSSLAAYYGFDLTVNPRVKTINVPTVDESIRDRQWADLVSLGIDWKDSIKAGKQFKLVPEVPEALVPKTSIQSILPGIELPGIELGAANQESIARIPSTPSSQNSLPSGTSPNVIANQSRFTGNSSHLANSPAPAAMNKGVQLQFAGDLPASQQSVDVKRIVAQVMHPHIPSHLPVPSPTLSPSTSAAAGLREVGILDDISTVIAGLERCEGLRQVIEQIESGDVQAIRDRYGPSEPGRRGTADPSWPKYSNLVSKRERIHRVLMQDFAGNKERFFNYFTVPPPATKKRKRGADASDLPTEYFRSFRKIVEAIPWREADIVAERQKAEYMDNEGVFSDVKWGQVWDGKNSWEIWREIGKERYQNTKKKVEDINS
ncbi:hypothetical protein R3P38DRAFT_3238310 [Favolaschia claudopus]|uniref:Uncharacterized protein n=1 Tax=Favolaschia claudopus TaxID=2862362 RepID=A0AAV9ZA54_9AGAR